jgi:hypothetical protein
MKGIFQRQKLRFHGARGDCNTYLVPTWFLLGSYSVPSPLSVLGNCVQDVLYDPHLSFAELGKLLLALEMTALQAAHGQDSFPAIVSLPLKGLSYEIDFENVDKIDRSGP